VLPDRDMEAATGLVRAWQQGVVCSLCGARRALKPFATDASLILLLEAKLRADVKASELEAERIEQMMLEHWSKARIEGWVRKRPVDAVADNIRTLLSTCGGSARQPELPHHLFAAALAAASDAGS
jgi:hypothetical protein